MEVYYLSEVSKTVDNLNKKDRARVDRTREFFESYGFKIGPRYIKKITSSGIWELRAGKVRLFFYINGNKAVGVHLIYKKTNKLPKNDIRLAERRSRGL
jgi:phage-related protein